MSLTSIKENYSIKNRETFSTIEITKKVLGKILLYTFNSIITIPEKLSGIRNTFQIKRLLFGGGKEVERGDKYIKEVFISVHYNDRDFNLNKEELMQRFKEIKDVGVDSARFDFRIRDLEDFGDVYTRKTLEMMQSAKDAGLTLFPILSTPRFKRNAEGKILKDEFEVPTIKDFEILLKLFTENGFDKPKKLQVLNEWNNTVYTPASLVKSLPNLIDTARSVFGNDTKLYATVFLGTTLSQKINDIIGVTSARKFVDENSEVIKKIDILGVDYYPNTWEWSIKSFSGKIYESLNISKLEDFLVFFGSKFPKIELDLGEVGCAKNIHFPNERRQAFYSLALLREIRTKIIGRFNIDTIGLYVAETPDTLMGEGVLMDFGLIRRAKDQMVTYLSNSRAGFNPLRESVASLKKTSKRI